MNASVWLLSAILWCTACGSLALAEGPARPSETGSAETSQLVDLNAASVEELTKLPGIGTKRAEAIVAFRDARGGFRSVGQLLQIKGIGRAMLRRLKPLVTVSTTHAAPKGS